MFLSHVYQTHTLSHKITFKFLCFGSFAVPVRYSRCIPFNNNLLISCFTHLHNISHSVKLSNTLLWRHNGRNGVSNHQPHDCLLNRLFGRRSKKTSKLRATGLCAGNSPGTGEFPAQRASNGGNVSIWWRHHDRNYNATYTCKVHILTSTSM